MRIKLSKQNWRLVGQKMGWLKRAQIETNNGAGVGSTGAAEAMGMGKDKITPGSLDGNTGNVDEGMKYNETPFHDSRSNIRRDQGLLTDVQKNILSDIDNGIQVLFQTTDPKFYNINNGIIAEKYFGSIKGTTDLTGYNSGPITVESMEDGLKNWWHIDKKLEQGRNKLQTNNYTPAQLQRFEKAVAERRQKLESIKGLVRNAFRTYMAGKPQIQNTGGLDFTGNVKL